MQSAFVHCCGFLCNGRNFCINDKERENEYKGKD